MTTNRPLRVFLCHSSNDKPAVRELYQKLRAEPWIQPWLDEEELYPGQDWNMEIEKAVEAADAIIVCLTKNSINKEGYVQRELRIVLDFADYKPEGTLYIIPVRLEECEPPRRLRAWQYADYFSGSRDRAFQRLLVSLKRRADALELQFEVSTLAPKPEEKSIVETRVVEDAPKPASKVAIEQKEKSFKNESVAKEKSISSAIGENKSSVQEKKETVSVHSPTEKPQTSPQPKPKTEKSDFDQFGHPTKEWIASNKITLSNGMEFMRIPAGKFIMGSNDGEKYERPQQTVDIPYDYWLARFPVTNMFYKSFFKSSIKENDSAEKEKLNHPAKGLELDRAVNYCLWLNDRLKSELPPELVLRLPTEAEWEKAARGLDGRKYPWGNKFDKHLCNTSESGKNDTTLVGQYSPHGDSPFGCADMAGNVWDWTHSLPRSYPYNSRDGRESENIPYNYINMSTFHILRGGSYYDEGIYVRCAYRFKFTLLNSWARAGLRVALAPKLT